MSLTQRDVLAYFISIGLRATGKVHRAKRQAFVKGNITVLYFHNPSKELFEGCVKWLRRNGYTFISSKNMLDILNGEKTPVPGSVWLTFDDGWKGNVKGVIPIAIKYDVPVTIFISTDPIENSGVFWWSYFGPCGDKLPETFRNDTHQLWKMKESERRRVIDKLEVDCAGKVPRQAMTIDDVKTLAKISQVDIGSHTIHHAFTPNCTTEELEAEIRDSKETLEKWTGKDVFTFSYPNGDFNGKEKETLEKFGIRLAATTVHEHATPASNPFYIPRISVGINSGTLSEAICHMVGIWGPAVKKLKGSK